MAITSLQYLLGVGRHSSVDSRSCVCRAPAFHHAHRFHRVPEVNVDGVDGSRLHVGAAAESRVLGSEVDRLATRRAPSRGHAARSTGPSPAHAGHRHLWEQPCCRIHRLAENVTNPEFTSCSARQVEMATQEPRKQMLVKSAAHIDSEVVQRRGGTSTRLKVAPLKRDTPFGSRNRWFARRQSSTSRI